MIVIPLQSGSSGNCTYVEAEGTAVILDAGIPGACAQRRLRRFGREISDVAAVVLSHDHMDHARAAGVFHRRFRLPLCCTEATMARVRERTDVRRITDLRLFSLGQTLSIGNLTIETIPTPHDGADGVAFVVEAGGVRVGVLTDLGHVFGPLYATVAGLDAVMVESNYDVRMLLEGPYPPWLQERIRGPRGHLSNEESAHLLQAADHSRLQWVCLAHLSEKNNVPSLALRVHREMLGDELIIHLASHSEACGPFEVAR